MHIVRFLSVTAVAMATAVTLVLPAHSAVAAPTPAASGTGTGIGIALAEAPASGRGDPRAQAYIVDQLRAGTTIARHVRVTNFSHERQIVSLYAAAASISGGQFRFADGSTANELSSWISVSPAQVTLAPGAEAKPVVTIHVPANASTGERYAVIWAQVSAPSGAGTIGQINRVGIRAYLDVSGTTPDQTDFQINNMTASRTTSGHPQLTAVVRNSGRRAIDLSGHSQLTNGPSGLSAGPVSIDHVVTIAPGGTESVSFTFDPALPLGPWDAAIDLASGGTTRTANATVTFPATAGTARTVPVARHSSNGFAKAVLTAAAVLLLLLLIAISLVIWRRRHSPPMRASR